MTPSLTPSSALLQHTDGTNGAVHHSPYHRNSSHQPIIDKEEKDSVVELARQREARPALSARSGGRRDLQAASVESLARKRVFEMMELAFDVCRREGRSYLGGSSALRRVAGRMGLRKRERRSA
ncbi:hypothetical protein CC78DRAFT_568178 [Lojkania enalia]|uniref:Uncharacterized protein n=1 Tax=Lojkania enalia TaxID=147567 RepID=A0A9P4KE00_9PLEO|nr:hypothetical protein CC78DRAFT_568178 [Didymosphaeria enalia]